MKSTKLKLALTEWIREPIVPVTRTEYFPAVAELQERDEEADGGIVTLEGEMGLQFSPLGNVVTDKVTVPANPPLAVRAKVETRDPPTSTKEGGDAAISKSSTLIEVVPLTLAWVESPE